MERRRFLGLGGVAALGGWLPGCGGGGGTPASSPAPAPPPPAGPDWSPLGRQMQGSVLLPGQPDFERVRRVANARYDARQPLAIARCAGAADVAAALAFAREQKLPLAARSGGHSYLGASGAAGGLMIDVGGMDGVRLDGDLAVVGAGAKLVDVYDSLITAGRCIPAGSCQSVGIAGLTLGGGIGVVDRAYGLSCDVLVAASVVTADGQALDCSATQRPELFWALRGGGGGQVALVTSLTFKTHAITPLAQFDAYFGLADLPIVLAAWQDWPRTMPDAIWSQLALSAQGVHLWGIAAGGPDLAQPHWGALLARIGRAPLNADAASTTTRSYRDVMLGGCANVARDACHLPSQNPAGQLGRVAMAASSDYFDAPLNDAGIAALAQALQQRRDSGRAGAVLLNLMGGAIARVAPDATAFAHRRALFSAQYLAELPAGTSTDTLEEAATWAHGMRATMQPWSSGGAYVNYLDGLLANPAEAYYGGNLARLRQVKQSYDPGNVLKGLPALT